MLNQIFVNETARVVATLIVMENNRKGVCPTFVDLAVDLAEYSAEFASQNSNNSPADYNAAFGQFCGALTKEYVAQCGYQIL